jgi:alanyl-tRNA synthetase
MRRIEAVTGAAADGLVRSRRQTLDQATEAVGAQGLEALPGRISALQEELREARRKLKAGGAPGVPKPGELAQRAEEPKPGVRLVAAAVAYESMDALKAAARDLNGILGSGVIALALDADEPQLFVTVTDDLVAKGVSAGELVAAAMPALEGRGGGRPQMAQGRGTRRAGLAQALADIRARLKNGA